MMPNNKHPTIVGNGEVKDEAQPKPIKASVVKKPRSPYILFFQAERQLIMNDLCPESSSEVNHASYLDDAIAHPDLPLRYQNAGIANPLVMIRKERRKHRKVHGKIGFIQLCKMIANRWKTSDSETKAYFKSLAAADFLRFKNEEASNSGKADIDKRSQVHPTLPDANVSYRTQNIEKPSFIPNASSQTLVELFQAQVANEAARQYQQHETSSYLLQTTPEESTKRKVVQCFVPSTLNEVCENSRDNRKRRLMELSSQSDISPANSFLEQKRLMAELNVARNAVANQRVVPLPAFSSNDRRERVNGAISHGHFQENIRVIPPSRDLHQFFGVDNEMKTLAFEQNIAYASNSTSHRPVLSFGSLPVPLAPLAMLHPTITPAMSPCDLHVTEYLDFYTIYLRSLLPQTKY